MVVQAAKEPQRMCIVTRNCGLQEQLLRFVQAPDGQLVVDLDAVLPGRGAWVTLSHEIVQQAVKNKAFQRALSGDTPLMVSSDIADQVAALLARKALSLLPLARKAGGLVTGFEKVDTAIARGELRVLIAASDGAMDGRNKLKNRFCRENPESAIVNAFTCAQLSLALGRSNVIHAGISNEGLSRKVMQATERLAIYSGKISPHH